jgi:hypothetical protein
MRSLYESLLDDMSSIEKNQSKSNKDSIKEFLKKTFKGASSCKISRKPNEDGFYVVDATRNIALEDDKANALTNGLFIWGKVTGDFICGYCPELISLEGAPEVVTGKFQLTEGKLLKSLVGGPKECGTFECYNCPLLNDLIGAPEKCVNFNCSTCNLKSLEGCPQDVKNINIGYIKELKTLKGCPQEISGGFTMKWLYDLISLEGGPKKVGEFKKGNAYRTISYSCEACQKLQSLKGAPTHIIGNFVCSSCSSLKNFEGSPKIVDGEFWWTHNIIDFNNQNAFEGFPTKANEVHISASAKDMEICKEKIMNICDILSKDIHIHVGF